MPSQTTGDSGPRTAADQVPAGALHGIDVDALFSHETLGRLTDSVRHAAEDGFAPVPKR